MSVVKPTWASDCGTVNLWLGDCLEVMATWPAGAVDAVVTDPPYGIGLTCENEASGGVGRQAFREIQGDGELFDPIPFMGFRDAILFGCNNYCHAIPPRQGQWYFWDKTLQNNGCRIAEGEYLWHKNGTKPRAFRHLWSGAYRASETRQKSVHPTQKPIALMQWCIRFVKGGTIADPFMGSGTTGVATVRIGRSFWGVEIDPEYFEIAKRRIQDELRRVDFLEPDRVKDRQKALFVDTKEVLLTQGETNERS
jgi:DNA modification methylase